MSNCKAYKIPTGDFICDRCGYQWDHDDERPDCKPAAGQKASPATGKREMDKIRRLLI